MNTRKFLKEHEVLQKKRSIFKWSGGNVDFLYDK